MKKIQKTRRGPHGPSMNSLAAQLEDKGMRLAATSRSRIKAPPLVHADDIAVDAMAVAQKAKLDLCRTQGRRGWDNPLECSVEKLAQMMAEAVCKGDPVDVANFAAMLQARGASHQVIAEHATRALLRGSREASVIAAEKWEKSALSLGKIVHDHCVVMQAAWIEWQHGRGAGAAMGWIHNTLCGPGFIPDEDAPYGKEAQAWFDANQSNPMPQCFCGRPSNIGWMGRGFCSEAHYQVGKAKAAIDNIDGVPTAKEPQ